MKNKKLFIAGMALLSVVVLLAIFIGIWFLGDSYKDFNDFIESAEIPGLDEGAVPQGMANYTTSYTYLDENNEEQTAKQEYLFISAYMKEGPSRLYVTGTITGYVGYVTLKNEDGTDHMGHVGGVATSCNNSDSYGQKTTEKNGTLWIASEGIVYCVKKSSDDYYNIAEEVIAKAALKEGDKSIQFTTSFKANNQADFCFFYEDGTTSVTSDKLYVGEFYRKKGYPTPKNHHVTTPNDDKHYAFVNEYTSTNSSSNNYGLALISDSSVATNDRVPKIDKIISIPEKIQGLAITQSKQLVLSESYGLANSHLYYYNWSDVTATSNRATYTSLAGNNFEYDGVLRQSGVKYTDSSLYVYFADSSKLLRDYSLPSMTEGLCANGDRIYVLFESGCYKYKMFVRQRTTNVYYFTPRV